MNLSRLIIMRIKVKIFIKNLKRIKKERLNIFDQLFIKFWNGTKCNNINMFIWIKLPNRITLHIKQLMRNRILLCLSSNIISYLLHKWHYIFIFRRYLHSNIYQFICLLDLVQLLLQIIQTLSSINKWFIYLWRNILQYNLWFWLFHECHKFFLCGRLQL